MEIAAKETFSDACIIDCEVISNCPQGGDAGHGGVTSVGMTNTGAGKFELELHDSEGMPKRIPCPRSIVLKAYGDAENRVLIQALEFALRVLKADGKISGYNGIN